MRVAILSCGAIVVREKENSWLFGAPDGTKEALDAAGIEVPSVVFTTALRSPGYGRLGQVMRLKEAPLNMNGLTAKPIQRKHGTDYQIISGDARILFSERGDVSVEDTEGYNLAIIKNKHRADKFGDGVITWPWKDSEYLIQEGVTTPITEQFKVWASMEEVPDNLKTIDGTSLSLEQANFLARVAEGSGENGKENWAIAHSQFKKSYKKEGDKWVKATATKDKAQDGPEDVPDADVVAEATDKEFIGGQPVPRIADIITAALHKAYNDTSDKLFQTGYLSQEERLKVAGSIGDGLDAFRAAIGGEDFADRAVEKWDADQFMQINKDEESWLRIYKSKDDTWRWATITSVATWDKQEELLSTKAMDWAIGFAKLTGFKGPLRYKHIPGLDGGTCDTQLRIGDFLFEAGTFSNTPLGLAMRKKLKEDPAIWQISPGLAFAKNDLVDGVYKRAAIFERSMTQRPANPFTIILHKEINDGEPEMKIMTEAELMQAAGELGMEYEEVKMMYERALSAGSGPLGLKEFTEVVHKATGTNASGFPGGANSTHDDEDEEVELKEAVDGLDDAELKHLAETVAQTYKEKGKLPPWLKGGDKKDDEEEDDDKGKMTAKKKDDEEVDEVAELKDLVTKQTELLMQQTKAMGELTKALAGGGVQNTQDAMSALLASMPRAQANNFLSQRTKSNDQLPNDEIILQKLKAIETQIAEVQQRGQQTPMAAVYDQFTSTKLNQSKGGSR